MGEEKPEQNSTSDFFPRSIIKHDSHPPRARVYDLKGGRDENEHQLSPSHFPRSVSYTRLVVPSSAQQRDVYC